jgi:4'-phosphopantetheinyl transferase EntD
MREIDPSLQRGMESLALPGLLVGHRLISPGDEDALTPEEAASINSPLPGIRRASGAARIVARQLMQRLGLTSAGIPKDPSGMPIWPAGFVGSLAHDETVAVAAVARSQDFRAVGIDIEPALPLPADMRDLVLSAREQQSLGEDPLAARVVFSVKEAVYKAVYPLDRVFLEFADIQVDLKGGQAVTRAGRTLSFRHCVARHIVALAFA